MSLRLCLLLFVLLCARADMVDLDPSTSGTEVTERVVDGDIKDVRWIGVDQSENCDETCRDICLRNAGGDACVQACGCYISTTTLLALTSKGTVYRSSNGGQTWDSQKDLLNRVASMVTQKSKVTVKQMISSRVDPNIIFLLCDGAVHFVSRDQGVNFQPVRITGLFEGRRRLDRFVFHNTEREWALGSSLTPSCDKDKLGLSHPDCHQELYVTQDLGKTWRKIPQHVLQFGWGTAGQDIHGAPKERVYATVVAKGFKGRDADSFHSKSNLIMSDDWFLTKPRIVAQDAFKFHFTANFLFVAVSAKPKHKGLSLLVSQDGGESFQAAEFPFRQLHFGYHIVDTAEGTVFIWVNHDFETPSIGNIYVSDSTGTRFSLSLRSVFKGANDIVEFYSVDGLEGIFLANYAEDFAKDPFESEESSGKSQRLPSIKTAITFDKGGAWVPLQPPEGSEDAECSNIGSDVEEDEEQEEGDEKARGKESFKRKSNKNSNKNSNNKKMKTVCSLHLHGFAQFGSFGPIYSTDTAKGILLATGNVGTKLEDQIDMVNTYLSRDGGLSWTQVRKGSHIYEISDHGALITMAANQARTNKVLFTWDQGLHWNPINFPETTQITNIVTHPSFAAQEFVVYGKRGGLGVVYHLNFKSLHTRPCAGANNPGSADSDFEEWSPSDTRQGKCLMGRQITYVRRKRSSQCFNGFEFEPRQLVRNCECTEEDWECDLGYSRSSPNEPCELLDDAPPKVNVTEACGGQSGGSYFVSRGYRQIAGDTCEGGVDHAPDIKACPAHPRAVAYRSWFSLLVVLCFGAMMAVTTYINRDKRVNLLLARWTSQRTAARKRSSRKLPLDDELAAMDEDSDNEKHSLVNRK
eukprot:GILK01010669.1.p1 GENE.GILK01010669.1~~GILK01010669.1.p1  ORF type:complete len:862 (-),score=114.68 GILK01010669.1:57-2642(-)